jgi:hypothetical protein
MKLLKGAALVAVAKKLYDEARKPENKRRLPEGVDKVKSHVDNRRH